MPKLKGEKTYAEMGIPTTLFGRREGGSLAASEDREIQKMIRRGRREADQDARSFTNWARSGCLSSGGTEDYDGAE